MYVRCLCSHLSDFAVIDSYVRKLAVEFKRKASRVNSVARFVQECIEYKIEEEEDPKFPVETLWEGGGDCEDKALG